MCIRDRVNAQSDARAVWHQDILRCRRRGAGCASIRVLLAIDRVMTRSEVVELGWGSAGRRNGRLLDRARVLLRRHVRVEDLQPIRS